MQPLKGRILCTEDHTDTLELLELVLTHEGFEVTASCDPEEVLDLARVGGFNLYILDVRTPRMSGIEICKRLREFDAQTPILFYSGAAEERYKQHATESGAQSFLTKPVDLETLVTEVERLTTHKSGAHPMLVH